MKARMPHLFENWPAVARRLRKASSVSLFLDFDGTLAKIVPRPSQARLPAATRQRLTSLAKHRSVRVCVISGRDRATLRRLVAVPEVLYLGLYGWQSGKPTVLDAWTRKSLELARHVVSQRLHRLPGIHLENKRIAFTVHYRGAPKASARKARQIVSGV